tara:strand:- start:13906 stop:14187 length:282 start_codon:yes stop_codon:yes gene_type:complete
MKLPLSYDQFKKNPIKAILFMVLTAVVFLYVENRINYTKQIDKCEYQYQVCETKIEKLEGKVEILELALRNCDSTLATASTRLQVFNELGLLP